MGLVLAINQCCGMGQDGSDVLIVEHVYSLVLSKRTVEHIHDDAGVVVHAESVDSVSDVTLLPVIQYHLYTAHSSLHDSQQGGVLLHELVYYFQILFLCRLLLLLNKVINVQSQWFIRWTLHIGCSIGITHLHITSIVIVVHVHILRWLLVIHLLYLLIGLLIVLLLFLDGLICEGVLFVVLLLLLIQFFSSLLSLQNVDFWFVHGHLLIVNLHLVTLIGRILLN